MFGNHIRLLLGLLIVGDVAFGYPGLRCFTTQCPQNEPVCIELCDPNATGCYMIHAKNSQGDFEPLDFHCTDSPINCNSSKCELDQLTLLTPNLEYCCCTEDLCNSWPGFTDHLIDTLSSATATPAVPVPQGASVCEAYNCSLNNECYHGYQECGQGDGNDCHAVYIADDESGKLSLFYKGCSSLNCSGTYTCHIDNDLMPEGPFLECCCDQPLCNQNITFTHPTQTVNYGLYECEGLGCNHSCVIINNQPSCYCDVGYVLGTDNITCVDIDECQILDHDCPQVCTNTPGSYECDCYPGYSQDMTGLCRSNDGIVCYHYDCDNGVCEDTLLHCVDDVPEILQLDHDLHFCAAIYVLNETGFNRIHLNCIAGAFPSCNEPVCKLDSFSDTEYSCCCYGSLCNAEDKIIFPAIVSPTALLASSLTEVGSPIFSSNAALVQPSVTSAEPGSIMTELIVFIAITVISIPLVVLIILVIVCIKIWIDKAESVRPPPPPDTPDPPISTIKPDFIRILGHGRFAKVFLARLGGRQVAVKVFSISEAPARDSWHKERDIYSTPLLKNRNILQYLSHEPQAKNPGIESYWLIFDYHPYGSLYDYLQCHTLTLGQFGNLAESAASGLAHLHSMISQGGVTIKPAIAHRDLKSKNILVKNDLTCAISDFGLAIKFSPGESPVEAQGQVGTSRYMAPEVLEGAISFNQESFLRIDVYAFGLILWEMASMCELADVPIKEYHPPFDTMVSPNPTIDEMKRVVAEERKRPAIPHGFTINSELDHIVDIITESWDPDAEARLSAQTIRVRLRHFQSTTGRPFNQASKESGLFSLPTSSSQHSLGSSDYPITPVPSTPSYGSSATMSPVDVKPPQMSFAPNRCQEGSTGGSSEDSVRDGFRNPDSSVVPLAPQLSHPSSLHRFEHQGGGSGLIRKTKPVTLHSTMIQMNNSSSRRPQFPQHTGFSASNVETSL